MRTTLIALVALLAPPEAHAKHNPAPLFAPGQMLVWTSTSTGTSTNVGYVSTLPMGTVGAATTTDIIRDIAPWPPRWSAQVLTDDSPAYDLSVVTRWNHSHPIVGGGGWTAPPVHHSDALPWWCFPLGGVVGGAVVGAAFRLRRLRKLPLSRNPWRCRVCGQHGITGRSLAAEEVDHMLLTGCRGDLAEEQRRIQ